MTRVILLLIISFFYLTVNNNLFGQKDTSAKSVRQINIDSTAFDTILLKLQLSSDSSFVIIGEAHDVKNTYLAEYFIIKNLASMAYKDIYIEGGESEAAILNMYLQTGDSQLLDNTRARGSSEYKEFISLIYRLNTEKEIGFRFHGYDFERLPCMVFLFHKWFSGVKTENTILKNNIQRLLSLKYEMEDEPDKILNSFIITVVDTVKSSFLILENEYKNVLKEDFAIFKSIIFNPITDHVYTTDMSKFKRDKLITQSMLANEELFGLKKGILIIGSDHIFKEKTFIPMFMNKLKPGYSITFFLNAYKNCETDFWGKPFRKYSSDKNLLKYIKDKQPAKPVITFSLNENKIIPTARKNISTVLVEFYDQ